MAASIKMLVEDSAISEASSTIRHAVTLFEALIGEITVPAARRHMCIGALGITRSSCIVCLLKELQRFLALYSPKARSSSSEVPFH